MVGRSPADLRRAYGADDRYSDHGGMACAFAAEAVPSNLATIPCIVRKDCTMLFSIF
jgi:hypothetical protein